MKLIRSVNVSAGQEDLLSCLRENLSKGRVLYLLAGGSNIEIEIAILNSLDTKLTSNLKMLLADERYGPKGHKDSNYLKLMESGLDVKQADFPDILDANLGPEETANRFLLSYEDFKNEADLIVGQLGIGDDGHIAGVLPNTPGVKSDQTVVYYESSPYKRITLSLKALREDIDKTYIFCFGANKKPALTRLTSGEETLESLPCLILKEMADVTVYNDQV
jgi:6-phosphogluconolactonase/glucosamine-6-phosphate isomerase/deaminase